MIEKVEDRIIFALDVSEVEEAKRLVEELDGLISFFKIGILLHLHSGLEFAYWLIGQGKRVFLDLKYFDVPQTVASAVNAVSKVGVDFLTIHGNSDIIKAAASARKANRLKLLAVTVLTSLDSYDIEDMGFRCSTEDLVLYRVKKAIQWGCDGVVASVQETRKIRQAIGERLIVVAPGIRSAGDATGDQKRLATPSEAIRAGADYLVIGRPIRLSKNPRDKAKRILEEMAKVADS